MSVDLLNIAARLSPHHFAMSHVIIAAGQNEVASDDLLDWIQPLLNGLDGGCWASMQLEFADDSEIFVRFRSGISEVELNLYDTWCEAELAALRSFAPSTDQLLFLALDRHENQTMSLLDGVASWLMLLDSSAAVLRPVVRLFQELWRMTKTLQPARHAAMDVSSIRESTQ